MNTTSAIPRRRILRAAASRIDGFAGSLADRLDPERKLRCNACGAAVARFVRYAGKPNLCPVCGASAKERLVLALLDHRLLELPPSGRYLHVGPSERALAERLRSNGDYVAVDLHPDVYADVGVRGLDLTELGQRRAEFGVYDLVYASHVLEHIPDDRAAMRAVRDSLAPSGEFWVLVPLTAEPSVDGDGTESVRDREKRFGQWDHVRQYGPDIADRLADAGFEVDRVDLARLPHVVISLAGLAPDDVVWRCR